MNKKQNLKEVTLDDFNIAALRKAAREGRLFIQPSAISPEEEKRQSLADVLKYVSRIDQCVCAEWQDGIHQLWQEIIRVPELADCLITTRGKRQGKPNYYRVTSLVAYLLEKSVYRKQDFSTVDLHLILEQTDHRNSIYTGSATTYFTRAQFLLLNRILNDCRQKSAGK